jgi:hypothetical protein
MGFFSGTVELLAGGKRPVTAILADHDLNEGHSYNWTGRGNLDLDGHTWVGKGDLVKIAPFPFGGDDAAAEHSATLSGVKPEWVTEARTGPTVRGRTVLWYLQFFDPDTHQPVDSKYLLAERVLDVMSFSGVGPNDRSITVTSEDVWANGNVAEHANFSAADQQVLFPGDEGLDFVAELVPGTRVKWPDFSTTG